MEFQKVLLHHLNKQLLKGELLTNFQIIINVQYSNLGYSRLSWL